MRLSPEQRLDWLQLIRCDNIGPRTFHMLMNRHGGAAQALAALPELIRQGKGRAITIASREKALREMAAAEKLGARFVALGEPEYPPLLREIDSPPPLLAMRGRIEVLQQPMAALVGSRNASAAGLAMTERLARGLAAADFIIVSGLARGVDARAHQATLATGTVGVMAGGLDSPYPPEHVKLIEQIIEQGCVISEMPFGYEPRGRDFPRRNRLVSGLSLGVVVVEAARRSGSLITARFAGDQGREVFAVPGHPLDPRGEGANDLLRGGATFCTKVEDIVAALAPIIGRKTRPGMLFEPDPFAPDEPLWDEPLLDEFGGPDEEVAVEKPDFAASKNRGFEKANEAAPAPQSPRLMVESLLGPSPIGVDDLARVSGHATREVRMILQEMELEGRIERHGGDRVSLLDNDWAG